MDTIKISYAVDTFLSPFEMRECHQIISVWSRIDVKIEMMLNTNCIWCGGAYCLYDSHWKGAHSMSRPLYLSTVRNDIWPTLKNIYIDIQVKVLYLRWIRVILKYLKTTLDDIMTWNYFPHYCPFVRESTGQRLIPLTKGLYHQLQVDSPHEGPVKRAFLVISLVCAWRNGWANTGAACDLRRHDAMWRLFHVVVIPMNHSDTSTYIIPMPPPKTHPHHSLPKHQHPWETPLLAEAIITLLEITIAFTCRITIILLEIIITFTCKITITLLEITITLLVTELQRSM